MKNRVFSLLLLISVLSVSCKEDENKVTIFEGYLVNYASDKLVANEWIEIIRHDGLIGSGSLSSRNLALEYLNPVYDSVQTASDGYYYLSVENNLKDYYDLNINNPYYTIVTYPLVEPFPSISENGVNKKNILVGEVAFLEVSFIDDAQVMGNHLTFSLEYSIRPFDYTSGSWQYNPVPADLFEEDTIVSDQTKVYSVVYDKKETANLKWLIKKQIGEFQFDSLNQFTDSVYLTLGDTTRYQIVY